MKLKQAVLAHLGRDELKRIVDELDLAGVDRRSVEDLRRSLSRSRRATPAMLLEFLSETQVKAVCEAVEISPVGRRAQLIERLLGTSAAAVENQADATRQPTAADAAPLSRQPGPAPEAPMPGEDADTKATRQPAEPARPAGGAREAGGKRAIEHYEHSDKTRMNNPPVGLVTPHTDPDSGKKRYAFDPHLDPTLVWAGKAEQSAIEVPTVSLHVHERIDPRTIIDAVRKRNGGANAGPGADAKPKRRRAGAGAALVVRGAAREPALA